jgi:hypothetical protein
MLLKVFTKEDGLDTNNAINLSKELEPEEFQVEYLDLDAPESYQQAEIYRIFCSPSFVVTDGEGREINSWRGVIPSLDEIKNYLRQ